MHSAPPLPKQAKIEQSRPAELADFKKDKVEFSRVHQKGSEGTSILLLGG